jgi:hypothetical protein
VALLRDHNDPIPKLVGIVVGILALLLSLVE